MSTMTDTMTGQGWCDRYGVAFDWSADGYKTDHGGWEHHAYTITLQRENTFGGGVESVSFPWRQGLAVDDEPTPDRVLWAVTSDVRAGGLDWEEFCAEFGYDDDSLSDFRTYEACIKIRQELYGFMVSESMWEDFLSIVEAEGA